MPGKGLKSRHSHGGPAIQISLQGGVQFDLGLDPSETCSSVATPAMDHCINQASIKKTPISHGQDVGSNTVSMNGSMNQDPNQVSFMRNPFSAKQNDGSCTVATPTINEVMNQTSIERNRVCDNYNYGSSTTKFANLT